MTSSRLPLTLRTTIKLTVGACPACSIYVAPGLAPSSVVYRRTNRSLTMRCDWVDARRGSRAARGAA